MTKHAIWILRSWLACQTVEYWLARRRPQITCASQLFAGVSLIGAVLLILWGWRVGPGLTRRLRGRIRAHPLGAAAVAGWISALIGFEPLSQAGLLIEGKALLIGAFALSGTWMIRHRLRLVIAAGAIGLLSHSLLGRRRPS